MKRDKAASLLGLAARAGKVKSGELPVEKAVKSGQARLVILAMDASDNTKKKVRNMCTFYKVHEIEYLTREDLGKAIGKEFRAVCVILDGQFASAVINSIEEKSGKVGAVNGKNQNS